MRQITEHFYYQLKQALLSLKQKPSFVLSVVATMGLTLGALLCVFTLHYLLVFEPLPYPEQERLYVAEHKIIGAEKETMTVAFSYAGLVHLYKNGGVFEQTAMIIYDQDVILSNTKKSLLNTAYVTPEFHKMLAAPLALGRVFENSEAIDMNNPVAILSYNTWQQEYDGDVNILSEKININDVSYRVIGVLKKSFIEPQLAEIGLKTQIWLPWDFNKLGREQKHSFTNIHGNLKFIGKLKSGVSGSQAKHHVSPLVSNRWKKGVMEFEFFKDWSVDVEVSSLKDITLGDSNKIANILLVSVLGLLLIACTNISNLFMSRGLEKQKKIAIEIAIGATSKHIFKTMLAETSVLLFISSTLALVIAQAGFIILQKYLVTELPRVNELSLSSVTIYCAIVLTLMLAIIFAKLSSRLLKYNRLNTRLQTSGKGSGLQISKAARQILIISQVTVVTILIFINLGILTQAVKTINMPIGFNTNNISTVTLNLSSTEAPTKEQRIIIMAAIIKKLSAFPKIEYVAQGSSPLDGFGIKLLTKKTTNKKYTPYFKRIDHRYFKMIEQNMISGENFTKETRQNSSLMIVNQAFADQLKDDGDVIGMELTSIKEPNFKIIGIVKDITLHGQTAFGTEDQTANIPRSYAPNQINEANFMIKIKPDQTVSRQQIDKLLSEVDSRYSVHSLNAVTDLVTKSLFAEITMAVTSIVIALITFMLAGLGLFGVISYSTQMRQFEIGTRLAIGAKGKDIVWLILKENMSALATGLCISVLLLIGLYFSFAQYLTSYISTELLTPLLVTLLLVSLLSFLSCYLPLRQYINKPVIHSLKSND